MRIPNFGDFLISESVLPVEHRDFTPEENAIAATLNKLRDGGDNTKTTFDSVEYGKTTEDLDYDEDEPDLIADDDYVIFFDYVDEDGDKYTCSVGGEYTLTGYSDRYGDYLFDIDVTINSITSEDLETKIDDVMIYTDEGGKNEKTIRNVIEKLGNEFKEDLYDTIEAYLRSEIVI